MYNFEGKKAFVTGGTKGMGRAIAMRLAELGAVVAVTAREIPADFPLKGVSADISEREGALKITEYVKSEFGSVDILVNNAGGSKSPMGGFAAQTDDEWQRMFEFNLFGAVRLDRALLPDMIKKGSGVIIHISSIQSHKPIYESTLAYAAAKAALNNYSKALSLEVGRHGLRVNVISPGFIETESAGTYINQIAQDKNITESEARQQIVDFIGGIPLGRTGSPEDVAELAVFLASDSAKWITGVEYRIDGGTIQTL
ncbi:SDR family oxidoreductase [Seleniivibrio woodruffii]|uniref:NAD(P)-dependent dehydrogenase (Short-subunit alcohol dehydrogenase family) n=1 Tax=Seleniivibrio woodruffii TaxID=1078050 RepID=A0A4R1K977_9BACT|nr:SDR family oxidoreductase [Seleniivibrio woodruffii]TCK60895.1 NAD(P)-dependent dehydrogenase (short-subunit alcohol dehydrogenase family) [Seleniivibrio woodruffii]TVZ36525.1 NAD(P)-dependent dehydrogenase (short-subunit alcohol dehydrogenase family) [Seleniivibrio woodruffii]